VNRILISILVIVMCVFAIEAARAADLNVPDHAVAGQSITIGATGDGSATLYLFGPGQAIKRSISLGREITLRGEDLRNAGLYTLILTGEKNPVTKQLYVQPAAPAKVNFLARPSRVPVAHPNVITGTAFVFDEFHNLVLTAAPVKFDLSVKDGGTTSRTVTSKYGVAFIDLGSSAKEGAAQFVASAGQANVRRVVQQVAAEPCGLRMSLHREKEWLIAETAPVRDCSGNPVPDGTIVTFIEQSPDGTRSTVDARIKKGIARAQLPVQKNATVTVAAGVVLGNEVRVGGGE
jgi:hypothetical protein